MWWPFINGAQTNHDGDTIYDPLRPDLFYTKGRNFLLCSMGCFTSFRYSVQVRITTPQTSVFHRDERSPIHIPPLPQFLSPFSFGLKPVWSHLSFSVRPSLPLPFVKWDLETHILPLLLLTFSTFFLFSQTDGSTQRLTSLPSLLPTRTLLFALRLFGRREKGKRTDEEKPRIRISNTESRQSQSPHTKVSRKEVVTVGVLRRRVLVKC